MELGNKDQVFPFATAMFCFRIPVEMKVGDCSDLYLCNTRRGNGVGGGVIKRERKRKSIDAVGRGWVV